MIKYNLFYSDEGGSGYFNFYRASEVEDQNKELIEKAARWEAICDLLDGNEPSDFMLSFPEVRQVADLVASQPLAPTDNELYKCECGGYLDFEGVHQPCRAVSRR